MSDLPASEAFARGFEAGNYASAYTSTDFDTAWEVTEDGLDDHAFSAHGALSPLAMKIFRAGFVLGFFSSYEDSEISDPDMLDERTAARVDYGELAKKMGIALD